MPSNRQKADLTSRGTKSGFSSSQQVKKTGGVQASSGSGTPRNVARFGSIPGMPTNAQAPRMDNSTAELFGNLANSFKDAHSIQQYNAKREIATNDEISRNDTQVEAQQHMNALKLGFEKNEAEGNFVWGQMSGTPIKSAMDVFLGEESHLWQTEDFKALPKANQDSIKRHIRKNANADAMVYEYGKRTSDNKKRFQKLSELTSLELAQQTPRLGEDGELLAPDGTPFGRKEWVNREFNNGALTPGQSFSNINRAFQNDVQAMILGSDNPNMDVFEGLVKQYENPDGISFLGSGVVDQARQNAKLVTNGHPQALSDDLSVRISRAERNAPGVDHTTAGSGEAFSTATNLVGLYAAKEAAAAALGEKLTKAEKVGQAQAVMQMDAIASVNTVLAMGEEQSRAYMIASGWDPTNKFTQNDMILKMVDNIQVDLNDPDIPEEQKDGLRVQMAIAQAAQSPLRNETNFNRQQDDEFRISLEEKTVTGIGVVQFMSDGHGVGVQMAIPKQHLATMVDAFSAGHHVKGHQARLSDKGLLGTQVTMGAMVESAIENNMPEQGVKALFGVTIKGLAQNEIVAAEEFHGPSQTKVQSMLGGQATKAATELLDKIDNFAYASLFEGEQGADFAADVSSYEALKGNSDPSKDQIKERKTLRGEIKRKVENRALALVGRAKLKVGNNTFYPRKTDVQNYSPQYISSFVKMAPNLAGGIFVPNALRKVREGFGGVSVAGTLSSDPVFDRGNSDADAKALFSAVENGKWDHPVIRDNLLKEMGNASDPVAAYDLFMQDLSLNSEVVIGSNGDWHMQTKGMNGSKSSMASLPGSFQSLQAMGDDRFMKAVELDYESRQDESGIVDFFQGVSGFVGHDASGVMEGYVVPSKDTFEGSANDHIKANLLAPGKIDWTANSTEVVGEDGAARRFTDGNFTAVRITSSMNDYWNTDNQSGKHERGHVSSKLAGSDKAHLITRSFAPMFDKVVPRLLDKEENLSRASSEFNRHMQEQIEKPKREEIEAWMTTNQRKDLNVSFTVGTFSEDSAAFDDDAWDKGSVKPTVMALSARVEITDPDGNVVKDFEWDVRDEYSLSIYERSATN